MQSSSQPVRSALISSDPDFQDVVRELGRGPERVLHVAAEVTVPLSEIRDPQLATLRQAAPEMVFLDLEHDPASAIRFAQFLVDNRVAPRVIAAGPTLSPELFMAAMNAGISDYVVKPVSDDAVRAAVQRVVRRFGRDTAGAEAAPGQLFALFSAKGGSGCTTIATNLAVQLAKMTGRKTLLLDLDLELGEAGVHLGMQPRFSFVDLIRNFHRLDADLLASYIERHDSGVHLLSAPLQPDRAEAVTAEQIRGILHFLRQHYEYVVADTSKSFTPATTATLEAADQVFLVTTADLPSLRNIKRCLPLLDRLTGQASQKVKLVVNRYQPTDPITLDDVERALSMAIHRTLANDFRSVSGAINEGKPVVLAGASPFADDVRELGAAIAGIPLAANGRGRLGPLRKLFGRRQEASS